MKIVDPKDNPFLRIMFYGKPGSTKTRTVGTAAFDERTSPALMLSAGGNPLAIRDYDPQPVILEMETLGDFNDPYEWLSEGQPTKHKLGKLLERTDGELFKSVLVDGLTEVQRLSFEGQKGKVGPGSFPAKVERQHFYNTLNQMVNFARLYFALPIHVFMTSLEKENVDGVGGGIQRAPLLWGQSDTEVGAYAYVVGRLVHRAVLEKGLLMKMEEVTDEEITSVALFKPTGKYVAKDQYFRLGNYMVDPNVPDMLDLIME
jgi:hypothetical protein